MRLFVAGDTHGEEDLAPTLNTKHFPEQKDLSKDDYVVILGDFGVIWGDGRKALKMRNHWTKWLNTRNFTTIVVPGNHENYDAIEALPEVEMFGNVVWKYSDSIFILQRGRVYQIGDKSVFTMGGAYSIDYGQPWRVLGCGWWKQEIPSVAEFERGMAELDKCDWKVDYVFTHTIPTSVINMYMNHQREKYTQEIVDQFVGKMPDEYYDRVADIVCDKEAFNVKKDAVSEYLQSLIFDHGLKFKTWEAGHFHDNWVSKCGKYRLHYRTVTEIDL